MILEVTLERSRQFANMSFVSALLIVALHSLSADNAGMAARFAFGFLSGGLCSLAIPWFFLAAGFFLAGHVDELCWWPDAIKKRVRTLMVPFWLWSLIIYTFHIVIALLIHLTGYVYRGEDALSWLSISGLVKLVGVTPAGEMPTMWFMRTLFVFVLMSPLLVRRPLLTILLGVGFLWSTIYPPSNELLSSVATNFLSLRGLFYFSVGLLWRCGYIHLKVSHWLTGTVFLALVLVRQVCIEQQLSNEYVRALDVILVPWGLHAMFCVSRFLTIPHNLSTLAFPLYVTHMMVVYIVTALYAVVGVGGRAILRLAKGFFGLRLQWLVPLECVWC